LAFLLAGMVNLLRVMFVEDSMNPLFQTSL
jgi:hypothetical protein